MDDHDADFAPGRRRGGATPPRLLGALKELAREGP